MRRAASVLLICATAGCDIFGPAEFPDVAGSYELEARFGDMPPAITSLRGSITLIQDDGRLSGSADVTLYDMPFETRMPGGLSAASVSEDGRVRFEVETVYPGASWSFEGSVNGTTIAGMHSLVGSSGRAYEGSFTAVKR